MVLVHIGLDESNHGNDPKIIAAVFSGYDDDVVIERKIGRDKVKLPPFASLTPQQAAGLHTTTKTRSA